MQEDAQFWPVVRQLGDRTFQAGYRRRWNPFSSRISTLDWYVSIETDNVALLVTSIQDGIPGARVEDTSRGGLLSLTITGKTDQGVSYDFGLKASGYRQLDFTLHLEGTVQDAIIKSRPSDLYQELLSASRTPALRETFK